MSSEIPIITKNVAKSAPKTKVIERSEFNELKKQVEKLQKTNEKLLNKVKQPSRKPSEYNDFMSKEMKKIKKEDSEIAHDKAFKLAAQNWSSSKEQKEQKEKDPIV